MELRKSSIDLVWVLIDSLYITYKVLGITIAFFSLFLNEGLNHVCGTLSKA